jgi:uncharacterized membrane protein
MTRRRNKKKYIMVVFIGLLTLTPSLYYILLRIVLRKSADYALISSAGMFLSVLILFFPVVKLVDRLIHYVSRKDSN